MTEDTTVQTLSDNPWPERMEKALKEIFEYEGGGIPGPASLELLLAMFEELGLIAASVDPEDDAEAGKLLRAAIRDDAILLAMITAKGAQNAAKNPQPSDGDKGNGAN